MDGWINLAEDVLLHQCSQRLSVHVDLRTSRNIICP